MSIIYKKIYTPYPPPSPYWIDVNVPMFRSPMMYDDYEPYPYPNWVPPPIYDRRLENRPLFRSQYVNSRDYGPEPFVIDIDEATKENDTFRTALWTGEKLQVTLMSIDVGEDIGLEVHPTVDQFIRIEEGQGLVRMGDSEDMLNYQQEVYDDFAIMVPAGKWHNLINTGDIPLKLYSIYAPPEHPRGTVNETKADAEAHEHAIPHNSVTKYI